MTILALLAIIAIVYCSVKLFKHRNNRYRIGLFASIMILLFSIGTLNNHQNKSSGNGVVIAKVVKKITAKDKYETAKKENVALIAKKKKLSKQAKKTSKQKKAIKQSVDQASQQQAAAQAQASQTQQEQTETKQQNTNMSTTDSGQIVGNTNSHIYHVPGQKSYKMNSANAVYFNTEQDAINAGYRRSQR